MSKSHLSTGKLRQELVTLVRQATGTAPVVAQLATVIGEFAVGSTMVLGATAGIAAIAFAYRAITKDTREAKEENDKLIESFEKAQRLKSAGGVEGQTATALQQRVDNARAALANPFSRGSTASLRKELETATKLLAAATSEQGNILQRGAQTTDQAYAANLASLISSNRATEAERRHAAELIRAWEADLAKLPATDTAGRATLSGMIDTLKNAPPKIKEMTFGFNELRNAAEKVNAEMLKDKTAWWKGYIEQTHAALSLTEQVQEALNQMRPSILEVMVGLNQLGAPPTEFSMPKISMPFEDLTDKQKDALREAGVLTDKTADKNAQMVKDAIWGSAAQLANSIVGALNIGGGGKGSSLGGALGSTAGFAAGFVLGGPAGGAIGSLIGNIGGSLIGGLFDHDKTQEEIWQEQLDAQTRHNAWLRQNTDALKALTSEIHNAPSGFKVAQYRYDATEVNQLGRALRRNASRGGVNPLLVGT